MNPKLIPYGSIYFDYRDGMAVICKEHMMKTTGWHDRRDLGVSFGSCLEGPHEIVLDNMLGNIREHILVKIDSKKYQEAEYFDIDGYLVPASKEVQSKAKEGEYFVTAQVKNSERNGDQVVIYAGKKGQKDKSQIFIDPEHGKLTFDQNNINPKDVFVKIEATFRDGSRASINTEDGQK